ncbi:unnamed protein product [Prunus armeniaca]|uniref:Uncharacterized protein n=1 Tax=Prunus armeniaca TaxID=36596 RepID=A0A6J5YA67_PRUAR|nr:unnamed protein product [Prunus armeniaca]CAB4321293.1 unnamed protein product [Prunus armeniaca]
MREWVGEGGSVGVKSRSGRVHVGRSAADLWAWFEVGADMGMVVSNDKLTTYIFSHSNCRI